MIHKTPELSIEAKRFLNSGKYRDRPILKNYPGFQCCFICLHPFLKIKYGQEDQITFETGNWSNKSEIERHCIAVTWNEILKLSGMRDIQSLDRSLAFYHRAFSHAERTEYKKLRQLIEKERLDLIPPQVDYFPEILENKLLKRLADLGYESIFVYSDIEDKNKLEKIENILSNHEGFTAHVRIETPDEKILIAQDFDQRFTYFFSEPQILTNLIQSLDLEGFFCNEETPEHWSYCDIPTNKRMTWDEDMKDSKG